MKKEQFKILLEANSYLDKERNEKVIPLSKAFIILETLLEEGKNEEENIGIHKGRKIKNPKELNLRDKVQVINGCRVSIYRNKALISSLTSSKETTLYRKKYKNTENFKAAIIRKTLEITKGY